MALSANASYNIRNSGGKIKRTVTIGTSVVVYQHALLAEDTSTGRAIIPANATTTTFAGIALDSSSGSFPITGTAAGGETVDCYLNLEVQLTLSTEVTQANSMGLIYCVDDNDFTDLATVGPPIGTLTEYVGANDGWVFLGMTPLGAAS